MDGAKSICDIGFSNWLRVLATVHSALTHKEVIGESLVTAGQCFLQHIDRPVNMVVTWTRETVTELEELVLDLMRNANQKLDDDVFMIVINSGELKEGSVQRRSSTPAFNSTVSLLMVPRNKYDLNYNGRSTFDINELITSYLDQVYSGEITYTELDGIRLQEYKECGDPECKTPLRTVKAPPPTPKASSAVNPSFSAALVVASWIAAATMLV